MIYFRSLLSKRYPDIFLFQSVIRLITDARQNFETFEVNKTKKKRRKCSQIQFVLLTPFENQITSAFVAAYAYECLK